MDLMPGLQAAALGFKLHTGWAALVAISTDPSGIEVLLRRRLELLPADGSIPRFVYHHAAELDPTQALAFVASAREASHRSARIALTEVLSTLGQQSVAADLAGAAARSTSVPDDLARILGSHALIHAAEGALFHQAIVSAAAECGLRIIAMREQELWQTAARARGLTEVELREKVNGLRRIAGPPWGGDQKAATAAALAAIGGR